MSKETAFQIRAMARAGHELVRAVGDEILREAVARVQAWPGWKRQEHETLSKPKSD